MQQLCYLLICGYSLFECNESVVMEYGGGIEKAILKNTILLQYMHVH